MKIENPKFFKDVILIDERGEDKKGNKRGSAKKATMPRVWLSLCC